MGWVFCFLFPHFSVFPSFHLSYKKNPNKSPFQPYYNQTYTKSPPSLFFIPISFAQLFRLSLDSLSIYSYVGVSGLKFEFWKCGKCGNGWVTGLGLDLSFKVGLGFAFTLYIVEILR